MQSSRNFLAKIGNFTHNQTRCQKRKKNLKSIESTSRKHFYSVWIFFDCCNISRQIFCDFENLFSCPFYINSSNKRKTSKKGSISNDHWKQIKEAKVRCFAGAKFDIVRSRDVDVLIYLKLEPLKVHWTPEIKIQVTQRQWKKKHF
jgi:hypothetical protein